MRSGGVDHPVATALPNWGCVLAVVAHPDDESFGLGAILDAFRTNGTRTAVLCLTHGEVSTLRSDTGVLAELREREFGAAAELLGVGWVALRDYPDGGLPQVSPGLLSGEAAAAVAAVEADGLLVFDPGGVTGHPDHAASTAAALRAAAELDLPVLGWTLPDDVAAQLNRELGATFAGHRPDDIDIALPVTRARQLAASAAHVSQAIPTSVLWRRLALLGGTEHLRWLRPPGLNGTGTVAGPPQAGPPHAGPPQAGPPQGGS
ncbi:N-acetylglucosaminyl deacetylase, LmbE family [Nakamurella panacisegetis]|uniref:N-acetylglucosaminyl deacetylase, LmbE family n=1 Tax=Nakamurella panacisegetis TaxID=1090615 RepID=A0A1H0SZC0_9ACTN|nr:PIG-L deacetylase family protein [Nakamurella panacisegetis]SDP46875.1 N-acetylglucosaminyl deacetylase, LmbE family [Nakamurella panacisegetis]